MKKLPIYNPNSIMDWYMNDKKFNVPEVERIFSKNMTEKELKTYNYKKKDFFQKS